jgi:hypothetical protein
LKDLTALSDGIDWIAISISFADDGLAVAYLGSFVSVLFLDLFQAGAVAQFSDIRMNPIFAHPGPTPGSSVAGPGHSPRYSVTFRIRNPSPKFSASHGE